MDDNLKFFSRQKFETEFGGRNLIVTIGDIAGQANGSCLVQYGETVVLVTATMGKENSEKDYFPLMVDYEERFYAAGKIKGSRFIKRETRPPDEAILASRLIDRAVRPLFDQDLKRDIQIIATVLSLDEENDPDIVAFWGAVIALSISDIPWNGPIAGLRVGLIPSEEGYPPQWSLNPTYKAREKALIDLVVGGKPDQILMIESQAREQNEEVFKQGFSFANKHLRELIEFFSEIQKKAGKPKRMDLIEEVKEQKKEWQKLIEEWIEKNVPRLFFDKPLKTKEQRMATLEQTKKELEEYLISKSLNKEKRTKALESVEKLVSKQIGREIIKRKKRIDGRELDEIRPLFIQAGVLPRTHGSALFQRGETQVLSTVTLGAPGMEQYLDTMEETGRKRFIHHYNFPPFCSGEVSPLRSTGRREVGHGALVERGLLPLIPSKEDFPYTIRVVSEVLSSNGSTSMASACASILALMDAGVPVKKLVAGIAIGLSSEEKNGKISQYQLLTDLQDVEDGPGGMDFKVIGTRDGITAIQMDTKTSGLSLEIISQALDRAKSARYRILDQMEKVLKSPRPHLSPYAPKISAFRIDPEKIRDVIGPGGRVINDIIAKTGVTIDIEQDGLVVVTSESEDSLKKAVDWVKDITREIKVGEVFKAKITRLADFGAFAEIIPGHEGLIHVSELSHKYVKNPREVVSVGDVIPVKVIGIDEMGRINLSAKALEKPVNTHYRRHPNKNKKIIKRR